jgi:hypothetical protein
MSTIVLYEVLQGASRHALWFDVPRKVRAWRGDSYVNRRESGHGAVGIMGQDAAAVRTRMEMKEGKRKHREPPIPYGSFSVGEKPSIGHFHRGMVRQKSPDPRHRQALSEVKVS